MSDNRSIFHQFGDKAKRVKLKGTQRNENATERYDLVGELARGGVGIVHRGRDNDLGRDVALKVLLDGHLDNPELVQRFVEEAQIGGQLQHPGIVPVYELGLRGDKRPYFAMKLVKGETLAARLAKGTEARRALLAVFREVCRTVAYAHARGVIHRDLKPSNVMIGNFGEVQVVDWGFAKVLRRGGVADERLAKKAERDITMISTVRSDEGSAPSVAGSVMGTPAYMPPEQALGRVEDLDEKSDVFSLGAILAEILTGKPPYAGADRMHDAAQALLEPVYRRLDECGADEKLVALCKRCLQPLPKDRPASAELLADEVAAYLTSADKRSHRARLRALRAEERAAAQRRARRLTTMTGASVAAALLIAFAAYFWIDAGRRDRARERQAKIEAALQDAAQLQAAQQWPEAVAAAERAVALGDDGRLARQIRVEADAAAELQRRLDDDTEFLTDLEAARSMAADHYDAKAIDRAYITAVEKRWPSGEVDTGRLRQSAHRAALAAAFDAWAFLRFDGEKKAAGTGYFAEREGVVADWRKVDAWARALDPESNHVRDALYSEESDGLAALDPGTLPAAMIATIGAALTEAGKHEAAVEFLGRALRLHPDDFWIHMRMVWSAKKAQNRVLSVRHAQAALAIRPESLEARHYLGIVRWDSGDLDGAMEVWRHALKRKPGWAHGVIHVARGLEKQGRPEEAMKAFREAIRAGTAHREPYVAIGIILRDKLNRPEDALDSIQKAIDAHPDYAVAQTEYAHTLVRLSRLAEAEPIYRRAMKLNPKDPANYSSLGDLLRTKKGKIDDAIRLCAKAAEMAPGVGAYHNNLGLALLASGDPDRALKSIKTAHELDPDNVLVWHSLGGAYFARAQRSKPANRADLKQAVVWLQQTVRREPKLFYVRHNLGNALSFLSRWADAVAQLRIALELQPSNTETLFLLGNALMGNEEYDEAITTLQKLPHDWRAVRALATSLERKGETDKAIAQMRKAASMQPRLVIALGMLLTRVGRRDLALVEFRRETRGNPGNAQAWCELGWCLRDLGRWPDAIEPFNKLRALPSSYPSARWLKEIERMVALAPKLADKDHSDMTPGDRVLLADMFRHKGRYAASVRCFEDAFRADPSLFRGVHLHRAMYSAAAVRSPRALEWMRTYVERVRKQLAKNPVFVRREMRDLLLKGEFAPVRDADDLSAEWKQFWAEVEALSKQAAANLR